MHNNLTHKEVVKTIINEAKPSTFYLMNLDIVELSHMVSENNKRNASVYKYAFYLFRIMNLIISNRMSISKTKEGFIGVWLKHKTFVKEIKHLDIAERTLRNDLTFMREKGLIFSQTKNVNEVRREYYFLTEKALKLYHPNNLKNYMNFVKS